MPNDRIEPLRRLGRIAPVVLGVCLLGTVGVRIWHHMRPRPMPPRFAPSLTTPWRSRVFGAPEKVLDRAGVKPGMRVVEVGPGPGFFTGPLARRVAAGGEGGGVVCVEVQPQMIAMLRERLRDAEVRNVDIVRGDGRRMPLPDGGFDLVFLASVIGETPNLPAFFEECARVLKPGGTLAVNEFIPDPDFRLPSTVGRLAAGAGLVEAGRAGSPWWAYTARYRKQAV